MKHKRNKFTLLGRENNKKIQFGSLVKATNGVLTELVEGGEGFGS